ncbi:MAG TPA: intimin, partial [Ruminococcaceae bacterium]|nr:intimin [Oscillospiraceae bacterium]
GTITYRWASDNSGVAVVDASGMVTAKGNGTATVTVTASNGASAS